MADRLRSFLLVACLALGLAVATAPNAEAAACDPVLLTAGGLGPTGSAPLMGRLARTVQAEARADGLAVTVVRVDYRAVSLVRADGSVDWTGVARAEGNGVDALRVAVDVARSVCPSRAVLLAGHGAGADVVAQYVGGLGAAARSTLSVALLGNPSFLPDRTEDRGDPAPGLRGIRPSLHQATYRLPADVAARSVDVCLRGDAVCGFTPAGVPGLLHGAGPHFRYVSSGWADQAARLLWAGRVRQSGGSFDVLLAGTVRYTDNGDPATSTFVAAALSRAGYRVTVDESETLPADLGRYGQVWALSDLPLSVVDQGRLSAFARAGGGVYLSGERPCCEVLDDSTEAVVNGVVRGGGVLIGGLGDPYRETEPAPVNPAATGAVATRPHVLASLTMSLPGGLAGVSGDNVLLSTQPNGAGVALGGVWGPDDVLGGGRLVVVMDLGWGESTFAEPVSAARFAENVALFLAGSATPPAPTPPLFPGEG